MRGRDISNEEEIANIQKANEWQLSQEGIEAQKEALEYYKKIANMTKEERQKELTKIKAPKGFSNKGLKLDNYLDNVQTFHNNQPFFYDKNNIFWFWNIEEYKYEMTDEVDLMNMIEYELGLGGQTISSKVKTCYIEAFKRVGRLNKPLPMEKDWIQFKNQIYNIKTKKLIPASSKYFATNPIPWEIGLNANTPTLDRLFTEWVGKDHQQTLHEIIAYCCLMDYPIQSLFAFIGTGRNGKSKYLELINRVVGKPNVTSTELDDLTDRPFEKAKLYKKLVCVMGETNWTTLKKTSLIKKLTGGDLIGFEIKNKNPFDDYNYAKILISSNSLPSSDDTSDGFYRRWIIIQFPNEFPEGNDILNQIPKEEYNNLAKKITLIISDLLERGSFTNQGTIEQRKENYIKASNPLKIFIKQFCELEENNFIKYNEFYNSYSQYLLKNKQRIVSRKEFSNVLNQEGLVVEKTSKKIGDDWVNSNWVLGLKMNQKKFRDTCDTCDTSFSSSPLHENQLKILAQVSQVSQPTEEKLLPIVKFESKKDVLSLNDLIGILLDKPAHEMRVDDLISFGVPQEVIDRSRVEGVCFESRFGWLKLL